MFVAVAVVAAGVEIEIAAAAVEMEWFGKMARVGMEIAVAVVG